MQLLLTDINEYTYTYSGTPIPLNVINEDFNSVHQEKINLKYINLDDSLIINIGELVELPIINNFLKKYD